MNERVSSNKFFLALLLLAHLGRRTMLTFSKIKNHIHSITIALRNLNGPLGGREMLCRLILALPGYLKNDAGEAQHNRFTALDMAVKRISHRADQLMAQKRSSKRNFSLAMPTNLIGAN